MMYRILIAIVMLTCFTGRGCVAALSPNSSADDVLDALDQRGHDLNSLTANVSMADVDPNLGDVGTIHTGRLIYQDAAPAHDGSNARFRVLFEKKISGKTVQDQKHDYVYAEGKLTDRDYERKQQTTRQMLKPGEKMEIFKLNGPFPLPLGQKKEDVRQHFDVTKIAFAEGDPKASVHLQLTPHADTDLARQFTSIDLWVDPTTALPVRVKTLDANQTSLKVTDLTDVRVNVPVTDSDFKMDDVNLNDGWNAKSE